jgi:hypothetical protein
VLPLALFKKKKSDENEDSSGGGVTVQAGPEAETEVQPTKDPSEDQSADEQSSAADEPQADKMVEKLDKKAAKAEKLAQKKAARATKRDPRKALSFFRHAETVAETRNYNYAIECYINGLRHDPDNMIKHEALRDIALRRKVSGDTPAKLMERMQRGARDKVDKMLHAEMLWSKDPLNLARALEVAEKAAEADEDEPTLELGELVNWIGVMVLEKGETQKPPSKAEIFKVRDLLARVGAWEVAVNATRMLMAVEPNNLELVEELKDFEAELAMIKGGYTANARQAARDVDLQQSLEAGDRISKSESEAELVIARHRAELEEAPEDIDRKLKLVKALSDRDNEEHQAEAISILEQIVEETEQYRHKMAISDIKMKQMNRNLRLAREAAKADKDNQELAGNYKRLAKERLAFELTDFAERVENYPTDMRWKYELGRRQFMVKQHDEAMASFQQAKTDPKYRSASHCYLGRCYIIAEWYDEAIDTLRNGFEALSDKQAPAALEMQWYLCAALVQSALENNSVDLAKDAQKVASQILQTNVNYRDIKDRLEQIRALVKKLQKND